MYNTVKVNGVKNEITSCSSVNTGLFSAMLEQRTVDWVACGHDHSNDFYGEYMGLKLGYGRKTGYGGYGPDNMRRGARVFFIKKEPYTIETWIREEGGLIDR